MKQIDNYMTVAEAAHRWGKSVDTIKTKLKPSAPVAWSKAEKMIEDGLIKYFQKDEGKRKEWIISTAAMEIWFGKKE